jgi:hypothetical protein
MFKSSNIYPTDNMLYGNLNILSANLGTVLENVDEYENTGEFVFPGKDDYIQKDFVVSGLKGANGSNRLPENFNMKLGDISPRTLPIKTSKSWLGLIENRKQG